MKSERQNKIIELITKNSIGTQEELAEALKQAGFSVTQATVSRDIRELNLTKTSIDGKLSVRLQGTTRLCVRCVRLMIP